MGCHGSNCLFCPGGNDATLLRWHEFANGTNLKDRLPRIELH
jgi:hypothetical protein